eukprot:COSAG01_NODE_40995_length_457_cov_0.653631_1_plen_101_part_10
MHSAHPEYLGPSWPVKVTPRIGDALVWRTFSQQRTGDSSGRLFNGNTTHGACPMENDGDEKWVIQRWFSFHHDTIQLNPLLESHLLLGAHRGSAIVDELAQ